MSWRDCREPRPAEAYCAPTTFEPSIISVPLSIRIRTRLSEAITTVAVLLRAGALLKGFARGVFQGRQKRDARQTVFGTGHINIIVECTCREGEPAIPRVNRPTYQLYPCRVRVRRL